MGSGYWQNPVIFLLNTAFTFYILILMIRVLLELNGAQDRFNPLIQFINRITEPTLKPLRPILPTYHRLNLSALLVMYVSKLLYYILALLIITGAILLPLPVLLRGALVDIIMLLLNLYTFTIVLQAILSWVNPGTYHPATMILYNINAPLLDRAQRLLPPMGGIDFSPILVLLLIQVLKMLVGPFGIGL